jgi:hypothetical protein
VWGKRRFKGSNKVQTRLTALVQEGSNKQRWGQGKRILSASASVSVSIKQLKIDPDSDTDPDPELGKGKV